MVRKWLMGKGLEGLRISDCGLNPSSFAGANFAVASGPSSFAGANFAVAGGPASFAGANFAVASDAGRAAGFPQIHPDFRLRLRLRRDKSSGFICGL